VREETKDLVDLVLEDHSPTELVNWSRACTTCGGWTWPCEVAEVIYMLMKEIKELESGRADVRP